MSYSVLHVFQFAFLSRNKKDTAPVPLSNSPPKKREEGEV